MKKIILLFLILFSFFTLITLSTARLTEESSPLLISNLIKPLGEPIEVYETQHFGIDFTCYWTPPAPERPICVWATNLPAGSSFPTASGYGSVSSTFSWQPTYCQAGSYAPVFYCGESCGSPLASDTVDINVNDVNRYPVIEPWSSPINIKEGEHFQRGINSYDPDFSECGDNTLSLNYVIEPTPTTYPTLTDFNNGTGLFSWTPSFFDIGTYNLTFDVQDNYGYHRSFSQTVHVDFDATKIIDATLGNDINITYEGVCTENCTKILFLQVVCFYATTNDGKSVAFNASEAVPSWNYRDPDTVDGGKLCFVDYVKTEKDPYYNGDDNPADKLSINKQGKHKPGSPADSSISRINDVPRMSDDAMKTLNTTLHNRGALTPAQNVKGILWEFETCAICTEGKDQGTVYGCILWKYTRNLGDADSGKVAKTGTTAAASKKFKEAVNQWEKSTVHPFDVPGI